MNLLICAYDISDNDKRNELTKHLTDELGGQKLSQSCYIFATSDTPADFYKIARDFAPGPNDMLWVARADSGTLQGHANDITLSIKVRFVQTKSMTS